MARKAYVVIANKFQAFLNCVKSGNAEFQILHSDSIEFIVQEEFPSGSGFDDGTKFNFDESKPERLVFDTGFHHMNENGYYEGWTEHKVIVTPSLVFGFTLRVTGRDKRDIKDYIAECFHQCLNAEIVE